MTIDEIFNNDDLIKEFMEVTGYQNPKNRKITWGSYIVFLQNKIKNTYVEE